MSLGFTQTWWARDCGGDVDGNSDGNVDDDDSHDNDNHLHSQLLVSWLWL